MIMVFSFYIECSSHNTLATVVKFKADLNVRFCHHPKKVPVKRMTRDNEDLRNHN